MTQQVAEPCISNIRTAILVAVTMAKKGEITREKLLKNYKDKFQRKN